MSLNTLIRSTLSNWKLATSLLPGGCSPCVFVFSSAGIFHWETEPMSPPRRRAVAHTPGCLVRLCGEGGVACVGLRGPQPQLPRRHVEGRGLRLTLPPGKSRALRTVGDSERRSRCALRPVPTGSRGLRGSSPGERRRRLHRGRQTALIPQFPLAYCT